MWEDSAVRETILWYWDKNYDLVWWTGCDEITATLTNESEQILLECPDYLESEASWVLINQYVSFKTLYIYENILRFEGKNYN